MHDIEKRVKKIIQEQLGLSDKNINNGANLTEDLGADSLDIVELIMALEEEFDMEIPDEDADKISTIQQAVEYIKTQKIKGSL